VRPDRMFTCRRFPPRSVPVADRLWSPSCAPIHLRRAWRAAASVFLPPAAQDEMVFSRDVRFSRCPEGEGKKIETVGLFSKTTISEPIRRMSSAACGERGLKLVADIRQIELAIAERRSTAAQIRRSGCVAAVELRHRRDPLDADDERTRLQAQKHRRPGEWLFRQVVLRRDSDKAVGRHLARELSRSEMAQKRPSVLRSMICTRRVPTAT